jgi:hypothetical protein
MKNQVWVNFFIMVTLMANGILMEELDKQATDANVDGEYEEEEKKKSENASTAMSIKKQQQRGISLFKPQSADGHGGGRLAAANRKTFKYSCSGKEDEGHYEHPDCKKYWQCLYVGTIFESALERKCPIGTMFHPIERICEISTMVGGLFFYY